jgi:hypothetical protein
MASLSLSLTVPDEVATEVLADFVHYHGYTDTISAPTEENPEATIPNPQTKIAFAKAKLALFIKESIKSYRANATADAARQASITEVEAIVIN